MGNSIYYTPNIEEFHVGFEYQRDLLGDIGWIDIIADKDTDLKQLENLCRLPNRIRVKYLDKEDFESLGWIQTDMEEFQYKATDKNLYSVRLFTDRSIDIVNDKQPMDFIFEGTAKNKSELRRLMRQLDIV